MKILIIEDEVTLAQSIKQYLEQDGCVCETAQKFADGITKSGLYDYDCVLVDITLPGGNGLDVIREMKRQQSKAGIIVISAKNSLDDKITGLEIGADDYLTKPFHLSELNARIKALVRRNQHQGDAVIVFGEITINPISRQVKVMDVEIILTRSEYDLLVFLIANKNRIVSHESLAEHLIGEEADHLDDFKFIYSHIKNLRKKIIDAGGTDRIKAIYGIGYKLNVQ